MRSTSVASGNEALRALREAYVAGDPFEIALLDFNMPGMDGEVLARAIKTDRALQDTVLFLMTSSGQRGDAKRMAEAGFAAYLTKPVRPSLLVDALATAWAGRITGRETVLITRHSLAEREVGTASQHPQKSLPRVLVAEDNPENQKVARLMLERMGCRVDTVANGKEAVEMAQSIAYDIVFMDCQMPEMDGYEATQEIRRREAGARRVPIVALTAHAMEGDRQKCLQAGMDDYVSKPIRREAIREVLVRRLRSPRGLAPKGVQPASLKTVTEDFDPEFLANLRTLREEAGAEWVASLATSFVQHTGEKIASLRRALTSRDLAAAKFLAHDLKGSCATFGASSIAGACGELEAKVGSNSFAEIALLVELLERLLRRLENTLARGFDQ